MDQPFERDREGKVPKMKNRLVQLLLWLILSIAIPAILLWVDVLHLKGAVIVACIAFVINVANYCEGD